MEGFEISFWQNKIKKKYLKTFADREIKVVIFIIKFFRYIFSDGE